MKTFLSYIFTLIVLSHFSVLKAQDLLNINDLNYGKESTNTSYIAEDTSNLKITTIIGTANAVQDFNKFHFLLHGTIGKSGLGIGVKVNTAFYNLFQTNTTELLLAKRLDLGKEHVLSFGLNTGIVFNNLRSDRINAYTDMNDPVIQNELFNRVGFTTGAGLRYNWKNKLDLGFSLPTIVQSTNGFAPIFFTHLSYRQEIGESFTLEPGVVLYGTDYLKPSVEGNVTLMYKDLVWLKLAGRSTKNIAVGAGAKINFFEVGYTYNNIVGDGFQEVYNNLHAVQVSFYFIGNKAVRTQQKADPKI